MYSFQLTYSSCIDALLGKSYVYGLFEQFDLGSEALKKAKEVAPTDERVEVMIKELERLKSKEHPNEDEEEEEEQATEEQEEMEDEEEEEEEEEEDEKNQVSEEKSANGECVNCCSFGNRSNNITLTHHFLDSIPMLVTDGVMTKQFYEALETIFSYFDEDKDGAWNNKELDTFYRTVNGNPIDKKTVMFLKQHFSINKKGFLTEEGFMEFYLSQTAGKVIT